MIKQQEIIAIRKRLSMNRTELAEFLRVDNRSVKNWEDGHMHPKGSAAAILIGLRESLDRAGPEKEKMILELIHNSVEMGGLSYLLVLLFERIEDAKV